MSDLIEPRVLKGFRDYPPKLELTRQILTEKLRTVFRCFGFVPIDTPALEYAEVLLRKSEGETEKQVFRFTDKGGRDVALRFDLTVPLARFIAEHNSNIIFPFKRYHIANVWRGEKPQAGRFREFMQCDFDIIGSDNAESDFEILNLIAESFLAMKIDKIKIHVSSRGLFNRFLKKLNIKNKSEDVLRVVDKLAKVGRAEVERLLGEFTDNENVKAILEYICAGNLTDNPSQKKPFLQTLKILEEMTGGPSIESKRLRDVYSFLETTRKSDYFVLDPSITRGLDYYTGIVYETFLTELPEIGSVCSGGRFNNLTGLYMKETIPGVGASVGLDRLIAALEQLDYLPSILSFTKALIFYDKKITSVCRYAVADFMHKAEIPTEVFFENKKMGIQYNWAESKGIPFGIFLNENFDLKTDFSNIKINLKDLRTRKQKTLTLSDAIAEIQKDEA